MVTYATCVYCRTEKPAPSGACFNCGAPLLEVLGTYRGRPITDANEWIRLQVRGMEFVSGIKTHAQVDHLKSLEDSAPSGYSPSMFLMLTSWMFLILIYIFGGRR